MTRFERLLDRLGHYSHLIFHIGQVGLSVVAILNAVNSTIPPDDEPQEPEEEKDNSE